MAKRNFAGIACAAALIALQCTTCIKAFSHIAKRQTHEFRISSSSEAAPKIRRSFADSPTYSATACYIRATTFLSNVANSSFRHTHAFTQQDGETRDVFLLSWAGENNGVILVAVYKADSATPSVLYRSVDGTSFTDIMGTGNGLNETIRITSIDRNPSNATHVLIGGQSLKRDAGYVLFVSFDGGESFTKSSLPGENSPYVSSFIFHSNSTNLTLVLASGCQSGFTDSNCLMLSMDGGVNWQVLLDDCKSAEWHPVDTIVYATVVSDHSSSLFSFIFGSSDYKLERINISASGTVESPVVILNETLYSTVYAFDFIDKFLYVLASEMNQPDQKIMLVSTSSGSQWNRTELPLAEDGQFYHILDATEGLIFIHLSYTGATEIGDLYTSGSDGVVYSLSLSRHIQIDLYAIKSLSGVYITSVMQSNGNLETKISYNRGGTWQSIQLPNNEHLQIYGPYVNTHFKRSSASTLLGQTTLSSPSAVGIVLAHGIVGDSLQYDDNQHVFQYQRPDVYISRDGGYSWQKTLSGPHMLAIADNGGLLVAVPVTPTKETNQLYFSTDEGGCWHSVNFTDVPIVVNGVILAPGERVMNVSVIGYNSTSMEWQSSVLNFRAVVPNQCTDSDYEYWQAHGQKHSGSQTEGCFLGQKLQYKRLKTSSWCFNGYDYLTSGVVNATACPCTLDDYECGYGYDRDENGECVVDKTLFSSTVQICRDHTVFNVTAASRRLVPGDKCNNYHEGSLSFDQQLTSTGEHCSDTIGMAAAPLDKALQTLPSTIAETPAVPPRNDLIGAVVVLTLLLAASLCATAVVLFKYRQLGARNYMEEPILSPNASHTSGGTFSSLDEPSSASFRRESDLFVSSHGNRPVRNGAFSYRQMKNVAPESDVEILP